MNQQSIQEIAQNLVTQAVRQYPGMAGLEQGNILLDRGPQDLAIVILSPQGLIRRLGQGGSPESPLLQTQRYIAGFPAADKLAVGGSGLVLDLATNNYVNTGGATGQVTGAIFDQLPRNQSVSGIFTHVTIVADDDMTVRQDPLLGDWHMDACFPTVVPILGTNKLTFTAGSSRPFNVFFIFSSSGEPVLLAPLGYHQERWGAPTVTKTAVAGTADSFTAIKMGSSDGTNQPDPEVQGVNTIHTGAIGQKVFIVDNNVTGSGVLNVNIQGLIVSGKTFVDDDSTGATVSLAATEIGRFKLSTKYHVVRIRLRADAAVVATTSWAPTIQYQGYTYL